MALNLSQQEIDELAGLLNSGALSSADLADSLGLSQSFVDAELALYNEASIPEIPDVPDLSSYDPAELEAAVAAQYIPPPVQYVEPVISPSREPRETPDNLYDPGDVLADGGNAQADFEGFDPYIDNIGGDIPPVTFDPYGGMNMPTNDGTLGTVSGMTPDLIRDTVQTILTSGGTPQQQQDAAAEFMRTYGVSAQQIEQVTGIPQADIEASLGQGGYDSMGAPITGTGSAADELRKLGVPIDQDYSTAEQDQISGLIDSGVISVEDAASFYGIPVPVAQAAYDARGTTQGTDTNTGTPPVITGGGIGNTTLDGNIIPGMGPNLPSLGGDVNVDDNPNNPPVTPPPVIPTPGGTPGGTNTPPPVTVGGSDPSVFGALGGEGTITTGVNIPPFLRPFMLDSANTSTGALNSLANQLNQPNALVSPFNALQQQSQQQAVDIAGGGGGYINQAQNVFKEVADDSDILSLFGEAKNLLENSAGRSALGTFAQSNGIDPTAINSLQNIASGGTGYGSAGFNNALQASIDAARPTIASTFSKHGGSGALKSGLAQTAMQKAASDAFAGLYGNQTNQQLSAANSLGGMSLQGRGLQQDAASRLMGADQNAGNIYSGLVNSDRSRQVNAAQMLPQMGLLNSGILGNVGNLQQAQNEREKLGGVQAMQSLLGSSFGNVNPTALLGNSQKTNLSQNNAANILGGALTGYGIGNEMFGDFNFMGLNGGQLGGIAGGLLGGFG